MSSQASERIAVVGTVDPQTVANTEQLSDAVDMSKFHEAMFILCLGNMAAETIDFKLQESATSGGTYTDISGKAITQLAAHASNNDNTQHVINLKSEEITPSMRFVKARVITGGATGGPACIVALGVKPRFAPASDDDLSTVGQIII